MMVVLLQIKRFIVLFASLCSMLCSMFAFWAICCTLVQPYICAATLSAFRAGLAGRRIYDSRYCNGACAPPYCFYAPAELLADASSYIKSVAWKPQRGGGIVGRGASPVTVTHPT